MLSCRELAHRHASDYLDGQLGWRARLGVRYHLLICDHCRRTSGLAGSWELSVESRSTAAEMLRKPVTQISHGPWGQETASDLRRFLVQQIESHAERKLLTARVLEAAG